MKEKWIGERKLEKEKWNRLGAILQEEWLTITETEERGKEERKTQEMCNKWLRQKVRNKTQKMKV